MASQERYPTQAGFAWVGFFVLNHQQLWLPHPFACSWRKGGSTNVINPASGIAPAMLRTRSPGFAVRPGFGGHSLRLRGLQVASRLGLLPQPVDRRHLIGLLVMKSVARADVHARFFAIWSSTMGNTQNAFTLGSQGCLLTACTSALSFRPLLLTKLSGGVT